jgi:spore germination protein YaaH
VQYAENYAVLNQYCDEVRVMAYDQGTIDVKLNASKGDGTLYAPTADPAWVEKVIKNTIVTISPKKVMLGIPTYGYEYQASWLMGATTYERVRSFTFFQAMDRADSLGIAPYRNNAGELSFTFASTTHINVGPSLTSIVASTLPTALAATNPNASTTFFVSFSDAQSTADKIALAKKYGLRGAMLFKADGDLDPGTWGVMH